jgi:MFS family permease
MDQARHGFAELKQASAFLFNDWRVPALILTWIFHMLMGTIGQLLMQYLSKRYGLTFSNATLLMTIKSGVIVLLLFVILPHLSTLIMRKFRLSAQRKDLYLVRVSLGFVAVGWMLVGLSPNIPTVAISLAIASLGMGFALLLRSFLTSLVEAHHIARVYSIISIVDTLGIMFGSPLLAGLFKRGLALGGAWVGLPFYFTGLVGFVFMLLLLCIQLRKGEAEHASAHEDG